MKTDYLTCFAIAAAMLAVAVTAPDRADAAIAQPPADPAMRQTVLLGLGAVELAAANARPGASTALRIAANRTRKRMRVRKAVPWRKSAQLRRARRMRKDGTIVIKGKDILVKAKRWPLSSPSTSGQDAPQTGVNDSVWIDFGSPVGRPIPKPPPSPPSPPPSTPDDCMSCD